MGIRKLEDGADSIEVRIWRQFSVFGMATDEEIYSLKLLDSTVNLTFYRVYCTKNKEEDFRYWDAYMEPKIDSFVAVSKSFPKTIIDSIPIQDIWGLETQSALHLPDSIGFLDGTSTSLEIASKSKYKFVTHHEADAYFDKTKREEIRQYMNYRDRLIFLFQSNKVYRR